MESSRSQRATEMLSRIDRGQESAAALMPIVYDELRDLADRIMRNERDDHTLQPTALVHEAVLRLVDGEARLGDRRTEFLAVAAKAMRNLLIDHARRRNAQKRGGGNLARVTLDGLLEPSDQASLELLDLHAALEELETLDPRQAEIVEMCFFSGMTGDEIAEHLGVHRNTVVRELRMARAWLKQRMDEPSG